MGLRRAARQHPSDLTAARELVLPQARPYLRELPFLADSGYEGAGAGVHVPVKSRPGERNSTRTRKPATRSLRSQGERGTDACQHALDIGLASIAFTEHADFTAWTITAEAIATMPPKYQSMVRPDGTLLPPSFDVAGYLESIEDCRTRFPALHILSGIELGEPHWPPQFSIDPLTGT